MTGITGGCVKNEKKGTLVEKLAISKPFQGLTVAASAVLSFQPENSGEFRIRYTMQIFCVARNSTASASVIRFKRDRDQDISQAYHLEEMRHIPRVSESNRPSGHIFNRISGAAHLDSWMALYDQQYPPTSCWGGG